MIIPIPYGKGFFNLEVPQETLILEPRLCDALTDERASFFDSLQAPIGTRPLGVVVTSRDRVVIVTSDNTRPLPNEKLVPWIIEALNHVPTENITIILGTGSHRPCTTDEIRTMFGEEVSRTLRIINHDSFDIAGLGHAGVIDGDKEILLNREYLEADKRITLGFVEPHFFAGFSGGPKAVMPGIAGIDTIMLFHSAAMIKDPGATWGVLEDNPVYGMALQAACLKKPDFSINVALNPGHEITGFFCGDVIEAHREGTRFVKDSSMCACDGAFDIVVTSNSGHPLDRNFYQTVKGICAAGEIVKERGSIICISQCDEGIPDNSEFCEILKMRETPEELLDMIEDPTFNRMEAWQVQKLAKVLKHAEVYIFSSLSSEAASDTHCIPCANPAATLADLVKKRPDARIAVLKYGPQSIPYIKERGGV